MISTSRRADAIQLPIIPVVADWIRAHPGTLSLGQGVAGYGPPPEAWDEIRRLDREPLLHRYQPVGGLPELVDALQNDLARRLGIRPDPARDLMITAGANAAFLQVILAICDPGDEVILPLPYYFNQEMALAVASVRPVLVPSNAGYLPDVERLGAAVSARTRAIVTVSPNNPSGSVYPPALLRDINSLCGDRGLFHISDETYERFTFDGNSHASPSSLPGAERHTISLFSFSKTYGFASWRVGCAVFPVLLREALRKIQDTHIICPPVISQLAALGCLRAGDAWVAGRIQEVAAIRHEVLHRLREAADVLCPGPAEGAFYLLVRIDTALEGTELTRRLIADHLVAVIPGSAFGITEGCTLRVAYGALTPETARAGIARLVEGVLTATSKGGASR